jgi:hypothetical protein
VIRLTSDFTHAAANWDGIKLVVLIEEAAVSLIDFDMQSSNILQHPLLFCCNTIQIKS